jgi:hypothetical protein
MCEVALRFLASFRTHQLRATSHTRLRAHGNYTSSTFIGGKGRAGTSSIHTLIEGPRECYECKMDVRSTWIPTWHLVDYVSWPLGLFQNPPLGGRPNTKLEDHGNLNTQNRWFVPLYHMWGPTWIKLHWNSIWLRAWSHYDFTLHLRVHDQTTWFWRCVGMAFGHFLLGCHNLMVTALSLVCEVALTMWLPCIYSNILICKPHNIIQV